MTSTRHDELVEEIPEELKQFVYRAVGNLIYYLQGNQPDKYEAEVYRLIRGTLKAVVDGMPLPGEVGRYILPGWGSGVDWAINMTHQGAKVFIALSPTGEEE